MSTNLHNENSELGDEPLEATQPLREGSGREQNETHLDPGAGRNARTSARGPLSDPHENPDANPLDDPHEDPSERPLDDPPAPEYTALA